MGSWEIRKGLLEEVDIEVKTWRMNLKSPHKKEEDYSGSTNRVCRLRGERGREIGDAPEARGRDGPALPWPVKAYGGFGL